MNNFVKQCWQWIRVLFASLGGILGCFLGVGDEPGGGIADGILLTLIVFVALDYLTGIFCAAVNHELSSAVGFKGIGRKALIFVMVGVANLLDVYVLKEPGMIRTAVLFFYLSNEGLSLLENAARLGLPLPERLKSALAQLKEEPKDPQKEDENGHEN